MKALEAPRRDSTVQEFEAFPPLCHRWDKHLQTRFINDQTKIFIPVWPPNRGWRNSFSAVCSRPEDIRWRTVEHSPTSSDAHILTITKQGYIYDGMLDCNNANDRAIYRCFMLLYWKVSIITNNNIPDALSAGSASISHMLTCCRCLLLDICPPRWWCRDKPARHTESSSDLPSRTTHTQTGLWHKCFIITKEINQTGLPVSISYKIRVLFGPFITDKDNTIILVMQSWLKALLGLN